MVDYVIMVKVSQGVLDWLFKSQKYIVDDDSTESDLIKPQRIFLSPEEVGSI